MYTERPVQANPLICDVARTVRSAVSRVISTFVDGSETVALTGDAAGLAARATSEAEFAGVHIHAAAAKFYSFGFQAQALFDAVLSR